MIGDIVYFALRLVLSGLVVAAVASSFRFARQARRERWPWRLAAAGGVLLAAAGTLSVYDAIDNVLLRPHDPVVLASWLWLFWFDLPVPILALLLIAAWRQRDQANAELSRLSVTDALTSALNRRGFLERAATSIAQARRSGLPAAVIMFDIDHFKAINDGYGHRAGDVVLRNVVMRCLRRCALVTCWADRWRRVRSLPVRQHRRRGSLDCRPLTCPRADGCRPPCGSWQAGYLEWRGCAC